MEILLTRTFLEVVASGSFVGAGKRLNVTQAAVSMRIRTLENHFGRILFVRNKGGAVLTPAGSQFERYATTLAHVWEQARHQMALPEGYRAVLHIGGQLSLWDHLIRKWLPLMRQSVPDVSLHAELNMPDALMAQLVAGVLDIGIMYMPQVRPGLKVERLFDEELLLVSTDASSDDVPGDRYVVVDWGPEFHAMHRAALPDWTSPGMSFGQGLLALNFVLDNGGSVYLPRRVVNSHLDTQRLVIVKNAPTFSYPAYVVYPEGGDSALINAAIEGMRFVAHAQIPSDLRPSP